MRKLMISMDTGVVRSRCRTAPDKGTSSMVNVVSTPRALFNVSLSVSWSPVSRLINSILCTSLASNRLSESDEPSGVTVNPAVEENSLFWNSSVYLMVVVPGVRSTSAPPAVWLTWKEMFVTNPVAAAALPVPMTEPYSCMDARVWARPTLIVSLALSLANIPVGKAANAKTDEITTNAIKTIAVSRPVIPFSLLCIFR